MARFLFVVPKLVSHVLPAIPTAVELSRRGHETAWAAEPGLPADLLPNGSVVFPASTAADVDIMAGIGGLRGGAALRFWWYDVVFPMARRMLDGVQAAAEQFRPDVLVVDQYTLAGAIVARRLNLPWATLDTSTAELSNPLAAFPVVESDLHDARVALQVEAGLPRAVAEEGTLLFSPYLVLVCSTEVLVGADRPFPDHFQFIGLASSGRVETSDFPWSWLDATRPAVLVSLGTIGVHEGHRFFAVAAQAIGSMPIQGVLAAPSAMVPDPPPNVLVMGWVPQLGLLRHLAAVVTHGGHNTVCDSLAAGLPLVVAPPNQNDWPLIANQVLRAGCGIRVSFEHARAPELRSAIEQALTDDSLRAGAEKIQRSFRDRGGPTEAAENLERLAHTTSSRV